MARHGGFAAAATITEAAVNQVIATVVRGKLGPFFFPMPQQIGPVSFAGLMQLLAPRVELHANPGNLVTVHASFQASFRAQVAGGPLQTWTVLLQDTVTTGLVTSIANNQAVAGIDLTTVTFQPLAVTVQQGPALPPPVQAALQSAQLAAAATAFVRTLPPQLALTPPLLGTQLNTTVPANFKDSGFSVFEWFTIRASASRIVARPLEGALTIAVDFDGLTRGDPSQLVDLTKVRGTGSIYVYTITPDTDPKADPILTARVEPGGGDLAATVNVDFLAGLVARISPQIAGTPITKNVVLDRIDFGWSQFDKPLRGREDGFRIGFEATTKPVDVSPSGRFFMQPYLQTWDGPTNFIHDDAWLVYIGKVEVDLPAWVDVAVALLGIWLGTILPVVNVVATIAVLDGVIPGMLENIENQAKHSLQSSANSVGFPSSFSAALPGIPNGAFAGRVKYLSATSEGLDAAILGGAGPIGGAIGVLSPTTWAASDRRDIPVALKLRDDYERLGAGSIMLQWQVLRADTSQVVAQGTQPYAAPFNGVLIPHFTPALYAVDRFIVTVTATLTLGSQVGDIWTGQSTVDIQDFMDRRHKFVRWGPHIAHFENAGTHNEWWSHIRRSRIHRTAIGARCREVKRAAVFGTASLQYFDDLPFPWEALESHRKPLCEYCFFGGPDKHVPFPRDDWF